MIVVDQMIDQLDDCCCLRGVGLDILLITDLIQLIKRAHLPKLKSEGPDGPQIQGRIEVCQSPNG